MQKDIKKVNLISHNFNWEHKLFIAGMSQYQYGVFSLEQKRFITPEDCDYVKFNDETRTFECHYPLEGSVFTLGSRYEAIYDYDGNLISKEKVEK